MVVSVNKSLTNSIPEFFGSLPSLEGLFLGENIFV